MRRFTAVHVQVGLGPRSATAAVLAVALLAGTAGRATAQGKGEQSEAPLRVRVKVRVLEWQLNNQLDTGFALSYVRDIEHPDNNVAAMDATFPKATQRDGLNAFFDRIKFGPGRTELAIQALESTNRLKVLSEPTLTVNANSKLEAKFSSGREIPYETLRPAHGVMISVTQFRQTGITLSIKDVEVYGFQGDPSQRYVKMAFKVNVTRPGQEVPVNISPQREIITQYRMLSRELNTSLFIPEHSPFIAGIIKSRIETENTSGIPFLSEIPIVGALFRNNDKKKLNTELVFMVSAEVLWPDNMPLPSTDEEEEAEEAVAPVDAAPAETAAGAEEDGV
jgi:general secretion pathway protein D